MDGGRSPALYFPSESGLSHRQAGAVRRERNCTPLPLNQGFLVGGPSWGCPKRKGSCKTRLQGAVAMCPESKDTSSFLSPKVLPQGRKRFKTVCMSGDLSPKTEHETTKNTAASQNREDFCGSARRILAESTGRLDPPHTSHGSARRSVRSSHFSSLTCRAATPEPWTTSTWPEKTRSARLEDVDSERPGQLKCQRVERKQIWKSGCNWGIFRFPSGVSALARLN